MELWQLEKAGRSEQILELSTKDNTETDAQTRALAKLFFAAAKAEGTGKPDTRTKTRRVPGFHQPGL